MKPTTPQLLDNVGSTLPADNVDNALALARIRWHLDEACRRLASGETALALEAVQDADGLVSDLEDVAA